MTITVLNTKISEVENKIPDTNSLVTIQSAHDVLGTFPEGILTVLTFGTYRGPTQGQFNN